MTEKITLHSRDIALGAVGDFIAKHPWFFDEAFQYFDSVPDISNEDLRNYAKRMGYAQDSDSLQDLFRAADAISVNNEGYWGFNYNVIEKLKREQGGFFSPTETKRLANDIYLEQKYLAMYESNRIILSK